jgi:hypothetical protein
MRQNVLENTLPVFEKHGVRAKLLFSIWFIDNNQCKISIAILEFCQQVPSHPHIAPLFVSPQFVAENRNNI